MTIRLFTFLCAITVLPGCALFRDAPKPVQQSSTERFLGTISMVNEDGHFVLIDFGGFTAPTPGVELQVRRSGDDVAVVKAGAEMRRPFAAADIVSGTPQNGDDVWLTNPKR